MALNLPLTYQVFGHDWLIIDGGKISKSLGSYKDLTDYINAYRVDAVRYFSLIELPFGSDRNFSEETLITRINSELCNILGNLVSRTIQVGKKYFDGNLQIKKYTKILVKIYLHQLINWKKY